MTAPKIIPTQKNGNFDTIQSAMAYMVTEEWQHTMQSNGPLQTLTLDLFDGVLILRSDGTWNYE